LFILEIFAITFPDIQLNIGSIDIVRKHDIDYYFYEIKTAEYPRIAIRQALSQLLEYAQWNKIEENIKELIYCRAMPTR